MTFFSTYISWNFLTYSFYDAAVEWGCYVPSYLANVFNVIVMALNSLEIRSNSTGCSGNSMHAFTNQQNIKKAVSCLIWSASATLQLSLKSLNLEYFHFYTRLKTRQCAPYYGKIMFFGQHISGDASQMLSQSFYFLLFISFHFSLVQWQLLCKSISLH